MIWCVPHLPRRRVRRVTAPAYRQTLRGIRVIRSSGCGVAVHGCASNGGKGDKRRFGCFAARLAPSRGPRRAAIGHRGGCPSGNPARPFPFRRFRGRTGRWSSSPSPPQSGHSFRTMTHRLRPAIMPFDHPDHPCLLILVRLAHRPCFCRPRQCSLPRPTGKAPGTPRLRLS